MECHKMLEVLKRLRKYFIKKTLLEKFLIAFSSILLILFIAILLAFAMKNGSVEIEQESTICTTEVCLKYATNILEKMNPSVDACNDFYEFACGSYRKYHSLPDRKRAHKVEDDVEEEIYTILRSLLISNKNFRSRSFRDAQKYYNCCIEGTDEFEGIGDLIEQILKTSDIEWSSAISKREWTKAIVNMILYGSFPFYDIFLKTDDDEVTVKFAKPEIGTKQTLLSEPAYMYFNKEYRQVQRDYIDLIESTLTLTEKALNRQRKLNEENCTYLHDMANYFFKWEKTIATEARPCVSTILRIQGFRKQPSCTSMGNEMEWVEDFLNEVLNGIYRSNLVFKCECLNHVRMIEEELRYEEIKYYAIWRHLARFLPLVSSSFRHSYMRLYEALNPINKDKETKYFNEKWKQCVHLTNEAYGLALTHIYQREGYHDDDDEIFSLVDSILKIYGEMFVSQTLKNNDTVEYNLEKLEDMALDINYPDVILDDYKLDVFYSENSENHGARCDPVKQILHPKNCFIHGLLKNECIRTKTNLLKIWYEKLNGSSFANIPPVSSKVHVDIEGNILTIPVGILRFPYYTANFYKFAKYGGISSLVVRELSRRIQEELSKQDDNPDIMHSSEKDCLKQQYLESRKTLEETSVSSLRKWEDIIFDNIALKIAYELYKRDMENEEDEPNLPNLEYNSDQLFFIQYAQMYCEVRNNTFSIFDKSISAKFKVNNAMMNKKEFADAFECPEESPMNPNKKCPIWE